jgi:hypothetical protein
MQVVPLSIEDVPFERLAGNACEVGAKTRRIITCSIDSTARMSVSLASFSTPRPRQSPGQAWR